MNKSLNNFSELFKCYESLEDPRSPRGQRYSLPFLLACVQSAVLAGAQGYRQIGDWIENQSDDLLKRLGNTRKTHPRESTIRKLVAKLEVKKVEERIYASSLKSSNFKAIAVDGKTIRAARNETRKAPHYLYAASHEDAQVLASRFVPRKKSEIHFMESILNKIDIQGKVITADALHTLNSFGEYLKSRLSDYVFIAKGNKKKLIDRLRLLDIKLNAHSIYESRSKGHGREEIRRVYLFKELPFWLHFNTAEQVFIIEREFFYRKNSSKNFKESQFGLTSLTSDKADAREIHDFVRGHWTIENKIFHVRDVTFNEDRISTKTPSITEFLICFHNMAMNIIRRLRGHQIAQSLRYYCYNPTKLVSEVFGK